MTTPDEAARESARQNDGKFGPQEHSVPDVALPAPADNRPRNGARFGRGDFGGYSLKKVQTMNGREGLAWSADIALDSKKVGHVIQDGNGGEARVHFDTREQGNAFDALVTDSWDFPLFEGEAFEMPHNSSTVVEELFFEHDAKKALTRARSRGGLPVMNREQVEEAEAKHGLSTYGVIQGVNDVDGIREHLRKRGELDGSLYFDGASWVEFE